MSVEPSTQVGGLTVAAGDDEVGHVGRAVGRIRHAPMVRPTGWDRIGRTPHSLPSHRRLR